MCPCVPDAPRGGFGRFFLPGPTEVRPEVLQAQVRPMVGHRGPDMVELMGEIQDGLKHLFFTRRPVFVCSSSATGLMEAAVRNGVVEGRVLSLVNGAFSARFATIAGACGHEVDVVEVPWGECHDPDALHRMLGVGEYDAVTAVHSETSTGALQDLRALSAATAEHPGVLLLVDSVSGVGGAELRADAWGLDFVLTGSQKALALPPGLAFGVASEAMMERSARAGHKGAYFDLEAFASNMARLQTPNTPALTLLYALRVQLRRIGKEGVEARWARHRAMAERTAAWVEEMCGQDVAVSVLAAEGRRSPTVTCIRLPEGTAATAVVGAVRERGWVIGGGYGKLRDTHIRIGHMGDHTLDELNALLDVLGDVLR